jgi:phosphatidylserine/phosphatidylglycerophosphate/cardiolipin synthase-like enzyme
VIELRTLTDGGQQPIEIAQRVASFLDGAKHTLDIAIYDINLRDGTESLVLGALRAAAARGVQVRLVYNVDDRPNPKLNVPPPQTRPSEIEALPFETVGVPGWPDLMHHKYVVRDGAAVWTGSTNWTDDSWSREENVIAVVESAGVAANYAQDFTQLWEAKAVRKSGRVSPEPVDGVRTWFSPKRGEKLAQRIGRAIAAAERRVRIASPVITSGPILGTLAEAVDDKKLDLAGVIDVTQVQEVFRQWAGTGTVWKANALHAVLRGAPFSGKVSTPYGPGTVHDYMHAKVTICDDTVFVGSFNLSHSGESNAENVLEFDDAALADRLAGYIDDVRSRYPLVNLG